MYFIYFSYIILINILYYISYIFFFYCLQSIVTIEDGKLVHIQRWDGRETSLVREVNGNALTLVSAHTECIHLLSVRVCVCVGSFFNLFVCFHHRHSNSETSFAHVTMSGQSNTQH